MSVWGPIYPNMKEDIKDNNIEEISAKQWPHCVKNTINDLENSSINKERIFLLKYEDFTKNPQRVFKRILNFLKVLNIDDNINNETEKESGQI